MSAQIATGAFLLATVLVWVMLQLSRRAGVMDVPNHRSSHSVPTPRGGGGGIVLTLVALAPLMMRDASRAVTLVWCGSLLVVSVVGLLDDRGGLAVRWRLCAHLFAGALVSLLAGAGETTGVTGVAWAAFWFIWTVSSINVTNFMDGIDGLIASQAAIFSAYLLWLLPAGSPAFLTSLALAFACLGFLVWNWPPAKIFLGDVGSGPIGLAIVLCGLLAATSRRLSVVLVFLPLLPLYVDATVTLVRRWRRGERLTEAHRTHLYQRMANGGLGHAKVTLLFAAGAILGAVTGVVAVGRAVPTQVALIGVFCAAVALVGAQFDARYPLRA